MSARDTWLKAQETADKETGSSKPMSDPMATQTPPATKPAPVAPAAPAPAAAAAGPGPGPGSGGRGRGRGRGRCAVKTIG